MTDYVALKAELDLDPEGRGYAGMTLEQKVADLNTVYRTLPVDIVSGSDIYNAIDQAEFDAIILADPAAEAKVDRITGLGDRIVVEDSARARNTLLAIFTAGLGPITRANLAALKSRDVSRSEELGFGEMGPGFIVNAEALP